MAERSGPVKEKFLTREAGKDKDMEIPAGPSRRAKEKESSKESSKEIPKAPSSRNIDKSIGSLERRLTQQFKEQATTNQQVSVLLTSLHEEVSALSRERKAAPQKRKASKAPAAEPPAVCSHQNLFCSEDENEVEEEKQSDEESTKSEAAEEESEEQSVLTYSQAKVSALEVSADQLAKWSVYRQMAEQYDEQAWKQVKAAKLLTKYTSHPAGQEFRAHEKDPNSPSLKYDSQKQAEAALKVQEGLAGAVGVSQTAVLVTVEGLVASLTRVQQSYND